jgi:hypothetical protein
VKLDQHAIKGLAEEYALCLRWFDQFVDVIKTSISLSAAISVESVDRKGEFDFMFLGTHYVFRLRAGAADTGQWLVVIECLRSDDFKGKYALKKKCYLNNDGRVVLEADQKVTPIIPRDSEFIFSGLLSGAIPEIDKPA